MTIISQRKHATFAATILLLLELDQTSGLQQSTKSTFFARRPISTHHQSTVLWSAPTTDEIINLSEDQYHPPYDWDEQFEELQSFMSTYGHSSFPQNPPEQLNNKYPMLKRFCHDQRTEYKQARKRVKYNSRKRSLVSFDQDIRHHQLEKIGFEFNGMAVAWYDRYHELIQYSSENGHLRVTERENSLLANWVYTQRSRRNGMKGYTRISESQIKLLDDIGFEWKSELYDEIWNTKYKELVAFRNKHGHFSMEGDNPLRDWIHTQRRRRHQRKRGYSTLEEEQIRLLDEIEFPWNPEFHDSQWYAKYDDLQRFQRKHGHCQPLERKHQRLYRWCYEQRKKYDVGRLSVEKIKLLNNIDFPWVVSSRKNWPHKFKELLEFYNEHDHLDVGEDDHPDLYKWMAIQRKRYHGTLSPAPTERQIEKLESMHFCWSIDWKERMWHAKYTEAVEFFKEHGHVSVTQEESPSLYNWILTQGKRYKKVKGQKPLSEEEIELLEQLDFPFLEGQPRMAWNAMYAEVTRYLGENGGRFPTSHKDDRDLSRWLRRQRHRYRCAFGYVPLSNEQKSLLESIDFPIYPEEMKGRQWYEKYDELVESWKEHGNFVVYKSENPVLYRWIDRQRCSFKGGNLYPLSRSQIYLLERIGFTWSSDRNEVEWQEMYEKLVEFGKEHGHLRVPKSVHPELFHWVHRQRKKYKGYGGTSRDLSKHQIGELENIGFEWSIIC